MWLDRDKRTYLTAIQRVSLDWLKFGQSGVCFAWTNTPIFSEAMSSASKSPEISETKAAQDYARLLRPFRSVHSRRAVWTESQRSAKSRLKKVKSAKLVKLSYRPSIKTTLLTMAHFFSFYLNIKSIRRNNLLRVDRDNAKSQSLSWLSSGEIFFMFLCSCW